MSVIYILLPLALIVASAALLAFITAARRGQFDDLDTPPIRVIFDDADPPCR
jgi:cbb3-type cytochrome oxidase maturation protein